MQAVDRIEVAVRSVVTYEMAHEPAPFAYTNPVNFDGGFDPAWFLKLTAREEKRSSEAFVDHYRAKYTSETDLPVWMATELTSLDSLSQIYANLGIRL